MEALPDNLWWAVVIATGALGSGMFVYGVRQKEPLPLVFGMGFGLVPGFTSTGVMASLVAVGMGALFVALRRR